MYYFHVVLNIVLYISQYIYIYCSLYVQTKWSSVHGILLILERIVGLLDGPIGSSTV